MTTTISRLRWLSFIAAIPFLYFVFTNQPPNWLYYLSLGLILTAYVGQLFFLWRSGNTKEVKSKLLILGIMLAIFLLLAFFK